MTDSDQHDQQQFDIAIVGGGMVGAALAAGLAQADFRVAVIESAPSITEATAWPDDPETDWDIRVSAITRASQHLLQHLGAWDLMPPGRVTAYSEMRVWDRSSSPDSCGSSSTPPTSPIGEIHFDAAEIGEPNLGQIIENRIIQRALWLLLDAHEQIQTFCPAGLQDMALGDGEMVQITLTTGETLSASLLVAADGANSQIRERAGIPVVGADYEQHALVATVRPEKGHMKTAWQHFLPTGPVALLPLSTDLVSIVWSTSPEQARELESMPAEGFNLALAEATDHRLGRMELLGPRGVFPLRHQHASQYIQRGLALVGDAAHVIHPLAGQGVNLGFSDAARLIDVLTDARTRGQPIGDVPVLRRYERARRAENLSMEALMTGFQRLFSNDRPDLRLLRNLGLGAAQQIPPLKHSLTRQALGLSGDLPSLMQPLF